MSDEYATPGSVPFSTSPNAGSAANDLRAAAEGKVPSQPPVGSADAENPTALKEAAAQKASQLRDFAGQKANDLKAAATDKLGAFREGAGETAHNFKGVASEQWEDTRLRAEELHLSMEDYVRENPTKAVLTAVGVGFVLGLLIRR